MANTKRQNIIDDLEAGIKVDMLSGIKRYGTSLRSTISKLIAEGYKIENEIIDKPSGSLCYFMLEENRPLL